jgi:hypothetical protein
MAMVVVQKQKDEVEPVLWIGRFTLPRSERFDGVVGYRICLTHRRSPVRTRVEPFLLTLYVPVFLLF